MTDTQADDERRALQEAVVFYGKECARLRASNKQLRVALEAMTVEWVDYMTINNLGDPWAKHNMKLARAALKDGDKT